MLFAYAKNKVADQLRGNPAPYPPFCFRCIDSTFPLDSSSMPAQPSLCKTWLETWKTEKTCLTHANNKDTNQPLQSDQGLQCMLFV